jgi:prepilin-type N-terminal cleavage/methylation domain-containing protein
MIACVWGAHACRVLATASSQSRTFSSSETQIEVRFRRMRKPARGTRALPGEFRRCAFTIVELLIVIAVILVLAGLILTTSGYVQMKGKRSRAEAEIAAISVALENYKADNGIYPSNGDTTNLNPTTTTPSSYVLASSYLYSQITGDEDADPTTPAPAGAKNYFGSALKPNILGPIPPGPGTYLRDPFQNSYGYSTAKAQLPAGAIGNNPTFDLWSTANETDSTRWIKNW